MTHRDNYRNAHKALAEAIEAILKASAPAAPNATDEDELRERGVPRHHGVASAGGLAAPGCAYLLHRYEPLRRILLVSDILRVGWNPRYGLPATSAVWHLERGARLQPERGDVELRAQSPPARLEEVLTELVG